MVHAISWHFMRNPWQPILNGTFPSLFPLFILSSYDFHSKLSCSILISQHSVFSTELIHQVLPFFFIFRPVVELLFLYIFTNAIELPEDRLIAAWTFPPLQLLYSTYLFFGFISFFYQLLQTTFSLLLALSFFSSLIHIFSISQLFVFESAPTFEQFIFF